MPGRKLGQTRLRRDWMNNWSYLLEKGTPSTGRLHFMGWRCPCASSLQ